jgi:hypothetical protein
MTRVRNFPGVRRTGLLRGSDSREPGYQRTGRSSTCVSENSACRIEIGLRQPACRSLAVKGWGLAEPLSQQGIDPLRRKAVADGLHPPGIGTPENRKPRGERTMYRWAAPKGRKGCTASFAETLLPSAPSHATKNTTRRSEAQPRSASRNLSSTIHPTRGKV